MDPALSSNVSLLAPQSFLVCAPAGFASQYAATGKGPIQNLADHLADPYHVTAATNGVSVPFV